MNSQYFSAEQIKNGELQKLLDFLLAESYGKGEHYNDIRIVPVDLGAFVVEWQQCRWEDHSFGGRFVFVEEDQRVVSDYILPDNSYVTCEDQAEYEDYLKTWLEENPGWVKTEYGTWTNEIENKKFKEMLEKANQVQVEDSALSGLDENGTPQ